MDISTIIMQYLIGGLLSLLSLFVWGWIFYKKEPERRDLIVLSFCAGVLSVVPIFLVLGAMGSSPISFGTVQIAGLDIYRHIQDVALKGGLEQLLIYILVSILVFFLIYVIVAVIIFALDLVSGEQNLDSYDKILAKSIEAPFIFMTLGVVMGVAAYFMDWSLGDVLWKSMMIGAVEEFAKHLVLRFSDENKFRNVSDAIEFSIMVALGFAFLENIIYFVDRIWLTPCTNTKEIAEGACLLDKATGQYHYQVGVLLVPFLFRSIFSTMAHVISSGIFGYFYGVAHFAKDEIREYAKHPNKFNTKVMVFMHRVFHLKGYTLLREEKLLEGALLAMIFHGTFDFVLDNEVNVLVAEHFNINSIVLIVPMIFIGGGYLFYLFKRPDNKIIWSSKRVLERNERMRVVDEKIHNDLSIT